MPASKLKDQLQVLVQLQAIDSQIYSLKDEKARKPQEIETLRSAFEAKKKGLADLEKLSLDYQKEKKERELELASKEEGVKKLQGQLFQLKTNKEYSAMLQQIQDTKADASLIEDKILESMDKIDKVKSDMETEKSNLSQEEKLYNSEKKKIEDKMKEIEEKLIQLETQRSQVIPEIDKNLLTQYDRILKSREGLAIVEVINNSCMGCNMFVPAQVINLIKMYDRMMTCEVCNRILFIADE